MVVLLKFIACSAILLLLFNLFLAKEKTFQLNRWILLFLIPSSMIIPFISFPVILPLESPLPMSYLPLAPTQPATGIPSDPSPHPTSPLKWFLVCYLPIFFLLLYKKLKALTRLINWTKVASIRPIPGAYLIIS